MMKNYLYVAIILDILWTAIGGLTIWWGIKYSSLFWLIIGVLCILGSAISVGYAVIRYKNREEY